MLWKKKRDMIDIGDLHRRGFIKAPKKAKQLETDKNGFVELSSNSASSPANSSVTEKSSGFFDFFGNETSSGSSSSSMSNSDSDNTYSKKEIDKRLEDLDNKLYRLEQRLELIERKVGVGNYR